MKIKYYEKSTLEFIKPRCQNYPGLLGPPWNGELSLNIPSKLVLSYFDKGKTSKFYLIL